MKIYHSAHVLFLLLALAVGLMSGRLWAAEDGQGTNVVRNLRVTPAGTLSLGGTAITNWTLLPVGTGAVSLVDFLAWSNTVQGATNALNTNKLGLAGGVMTGPLTNEAGFYGDGAGVTNLNATNLTGTVDAARLGAGTTNPAVFLRGDQTWTNELVGNATTNAFVVNTNQLIVQNGNVGIGTANPTNALTLALGKSIQMYNTASEASTDWRAMLLQSTNNAVWEINSMGGSATSGNPLRMQAWFSNPGANSGAKTFIQVDRAGSTRFVFYTDPTSLALDYTIFNFSSIASAGTANFFSLKPTVNQSGTAGYGAFVVDVTQTALGSGTNKLFDLATNGVSLVTVRNTGKMGIGTNNPSEKLEVIGNIKASGTNTALIFVGDGSGLTNLPASSLTGTVDSARLGAGTTNPGVFLRGDQVWTNQLIGNATTNAFVVNTNQLIVQNGNVGIGTANPTNGKFEVYQNADGGTTVGDLTVDSANSVVYLGKLSGTSGSHTKIVFRNRANQQLFVFDPANSKIYSTSYKWGIGGSSPVAMFHVLNDNTMSNLSATIVQGAVGQTGNLTEWKNSGGTTVTVVNASGQVGIGSNTPSEKLEVFGNIKASGTNTAAVFNQIKYTGNTTTTAGKVYQWSTNVWNAAVNTNAEMCNRMLAIALGANSTTNGMLIRGEVAVTNYLSPGAGIFIDSTAGEWTQTVPTTAGYMLRSLGYASETNVVYFNPDGIWAEIN